MFKNALNVHFPRKEAAGWQGNAFVMGIEGIGLSWLKSWIWISLRVKCKFEGFVSGERNTKTSTFFSTSITSTSQLAGWLCKNLCCESMMNIMAMKWYNSPETKMLHRSTVGKRENKKTRRSEVSQRCTREERARENINRKIQSYIPFYCWMLYE